MGEISILIPALNPDNKILKLVDGLIDSGFKKIIIVDDGSNSKSIKIFEGLSKKSECVILKHDKNLGKGRALKTGFNYFLENHKNSTGIVTVDADGQHDLEDVIKLANLVKGERNKVLFLGARNFNLDTPYRSRLGNVLTRIIFSFFTGLNIKDTQTGLRAITKKLVPDFLLVSGSRYEYELNMLLKAKEMNIPIIEEEIKTIYLNNNSNSHFRPLIDSIRIYAIFIKFLFASLSSSFLDFVLFWAIFNLSKSIFYSLVLARLIASIYNFAINKILVFRNREKSTIYFVKYYSLLFILLMVSYIFIQILSNFFKSDVILSKVIVETLLFFVSFYIQRSFIFYKR